MKCNANEEKKPDLNNLEVDKKKMLSALHNELFHKMLITFSTYALIQREALRFLKAGHKPYTKRNVFNLQGMDLTPEEVFQLKSGCDQFLDNMGLTETRPFEGLCIGGLFQLMKMFYYLPIDQETYSAGAGFNIDKVTFKHRIDGSIIILHNKIKCSLQK